MIPESFIQELKFYCDIESIVSSYVTLKRNGRNSVGLCPFHTEKTGSFFVYPDTQSFYCFGCGAGGDVVTFVKRIENLEYVEAIKMLAQRAGLTVPEDAVDDRVQRLKTRILEANREAARFFHQCLLSKEGEQALHYLKGRGLSGKIIRHFGLGYAPDSWDSLKRHLLDKGFHNDELVAADLVAQGKNSSTYDRFRGRVMFPIIDLRGNVIAFGGRSMDDKGPKYLNSSDTPVFKKSRNLFALNFAKTSKRPDLILCEGYMDVIAVHQAGIDSAVATLGTALTGEQTRLVAQYTDKVVIAYDSDGAGQKATKKAINLFDDTGVKIQVLQMDGAKDPDEYIKKFGIERFQMLLDGASNAVEYEIRRIKSKFDTTQADGKVGFLKEFAGLMADIHNPIERDVYITKTAMECEVAKQAIAAQVESVLKSKTRAVKRKEQRDTTIHVGKLAGIKRDPQEQKILQYTLAQERLLVALYRNPDYNEYITSQLTAEDMVTPWGRDVFMVLSKRLEEKLATDMLSLSAHLEEGSLAKLSGLIASASANRCDRRELDDYINKIKEFKDTKTTKEVAEMNQNQLKDYISSLAAKKK